MARQVRATVYDMMDAQGMFAKNPANIQSIGSEGTSLYKGPQEYPKMLYHPKGLMRQVEQGEILVTPLGAKEVNKRFELISVMVQNPEEEKELRGEGWHLHPGDAMEAGGGPAAVKSATQVAEMNFADAQARIKELEAQLLAMTKQ